MNIPSATYCLELPSSLYPMQLDEIKVMRNTDLDWILLIFFLSLPTFLPTHYSTSSISQQYSGIWFNIEMVPNEYVDISHCAIANYTWEGDLMVVDERGLNDAGMKMRQGSVMYPTEGQPGVLTVEADGVPSAPYVVRNVHILFTGKGDWRWRTSKETVNLSDTVFESLNKIGKGIFKELFKQRNYTVHSDVQGVITRQGSVWDQGQWSIGKNYQDSSRMRVYKIFRKFLSTKYC